MNNKSKPKKIKVKQLDALWSKAVRARDRFTCQVCYSTDAKNMQAMHIISRSEWAIRWDLENGICGCKACHKFFTYKPVAWKDWLAENGYNVEKLENKVRDWNSAGRPKTNREEVKQMLERTIKELEGT